MAAIAGEGEASREAAETLYERFAPSVYRYALSQVRSPQDAEDVTQNTFLRAFAALQRGSVPENEAAWLFKIAHNVCLSSKLAWVRRRRVETPRDLDTLAPSAVEPRADELFGLGDALAAMPPRQREAFLLREWQGLRYDEIAQRLDTSSSAVETLIFRARRTLAAQLERRVVVLGQLLAALRGLAGGGSLAMKAAGLAAVATAGGTVAVSTLHEHAPAAPRQPALLQPHVARPVPGAARPAPPMRVRAHAPSTPRHTIPARPRSVPAQPANAADPAAGTTAAAVAATVVTPAPVTAPLTQPQPAAAVDVQATLPAPPEVSPPALPELPELPAVPAVTLPQPALP